MSTEITVILKDDDQTNKTKFLSYEDTEGVISLSHECEALKAMVDEAIANFKGIPDDIVVKVTYTW